MSFLLDTNVVSEVRKPQGDAFVRAWVASVQGEDLYLSVLVLGEIRQGIERRSNRDHRQAAVFEEWLQRLQSEYADRVLPITSAIAEEWGNMNAADPLPVIDGLMAATAKVHNLTLVTRNTVHLTKAGVRLLNPFRG